MTTSNAHDATRVGLYVDLGGFDAFAREHGSVAAAALRERFISRAVEIGGDRMAAAKTGDGGILFTGGTERTAMDVAFALTEEFAPHYPYFPIHVTRHSGEFVDTDDGGRTIRLSARITAAPHPADSRPVERGNRT